MEYINGIEVIKAFNQGKKSYARFADKVRANAQYYYDWMRRSQLGMSMAYAFFPAQMLTVLPPRSEQLAALTMASTACSVISPFMISSLPICQFPSVNASVTLPSAAESAMVFTSSPCFSIIFSARTSSISFWIRRRRLRAP